MTRGSPNPAADRLVAIARQHMTAAQFRVFVTSVATRHGRRAVFPTGSRFWEVGSKILRALPPGALDIYLIELQRRINLSLPLVRAEVMASYTKKRAPAKSRTRKKKSRAEKMEERDRLARWRWKGGPGTRNPRQFG